MPERREFLKTMASFSLMTLPGTSFSVTFAQNEKKITRSGDAKIKISLNAYSFNTALREGQMTLDDLLEFCAELNFDALDLTAYYFPGYPQTPSDDYLYHLKKKSFLLGLDISGTGVKNDFTESDKSKRGNDIALIRNWTDSAAKIGAPVLRVFAGKQTPAGFTRDQISTWMVEALKACVVYAAQRGVIIAIQNHNEFLKTADQTLALLERVNSDWFGLVLDIGSLRSGDPYEEIFRLAPYAVNWQIKEFVYRNGKQEKTDVKKIVDILKEIGYRGYIPIETLGPGEPKEKVRRFLEEVRAALS